MALTRKMNLLPVIPVYVGDRAAMEMNLSIITYDSKLAEMRPLTNIDELFSSRDNSKISWINISGLKDVASIKRLGEFFNIHPLTVEDILHTEQQPKVEIFDDYRFLSIKTVQRGKKSLVKGKKFSGFQRRKKDDDEIEKFLIDQVSIIVMNNVLITIQEIPGDSFNGIRKMILDGIGEIRRMGTDYLAYAIIDAVVDEYSLTLNHLEDDIEIFEDNALQTSDERFIEKIQETKKYLLRIKQAIVPLKDILIVIARHENFFRTAELKPFLQDLSEHLSNAIAMVENNREWLTNIMNVNISVLSYQMNKVMKVLAIISTIFIPLTFIAGVYGMNFDFMPELGYRFGYPVVLGGMGMLAAVMIIFFKIRRWF